MSSVQVSPTTTPAEELAEAVIVSITQHDIWHPSALATIRQAVVQAYEGQAQTTESTVKQQALQTTQAVEALVKNAIQHANQMGIAPDRLRLVETTRTESGPDGTLITRSYHIEISEPEEK